jgi:hypothetical protein
VEQPFLG